MLILPSVLQGTFGAALLSFGLSLSIVTWLHLVVKAWHDSKAWALAVFVCPVLMPFSLAFFPNISPRSAFLSICGMLMVVGVLATQTNLFI